MGSPEPSCFMRTRNCKQLGKGNTGRLRSGALTEKKTEEKGAAVSTVQPHRQGGERPRRRIKNVGISLRGERGKRGRAKGGTRRKKGVSKTAKGRRNFKPLLYALRKRKRGGNIPPGETFQTDEVWRAKKNQTKIKIKERR